MYSAASDVCRFWASFMSCNFMSCHLVRHLRVRHFQSNPQNIRKVSVKTRVWSGRWTIGLGLDDGEVRWTMRGLAAGHVLCLVLYNPQRASRSTDRERQSRFQRKSVKRKNGQIDRNPSTTRSLNTETMLTAEAWNALAWTGRLRLRP